MLRAMREQRLGSLDVTITGGTDRQGGGGGPLVVLLHGFGAPGTDLVPLWRAIDVSREIRFAFPAAPLTLPSMGFGAESRAWWMIDVLELERAIAEGRQRDQSKMTPEGLVEAREQVLEMLEALEGELSPSALVLGGFSQGAMLSLDVALHSDRALAGLIHWSGTVLNEDEWVPRMAARKGLPVLQSHGRMDPLLPFSLAEALRDRLVAAGLDVEFLAFNGGHEIPGQVLDRFEAFLKTHVA